MKRLLVEVIFIFQRYHRQTQQVKVSGRANSSLGDEVVQKDETKGITTKKNTKKKEKWLGTAQKEKNFVVETA